MHATVVWVFALLYAMCGEVGLLLNHLLLIVDYQLALVDGCLPSNNESVDLLYLFVRGENDSLSDMPSESLRTPSKRSFCPDFVESPGWKKLMEDVFAGNSPAYPEYALSENSVVRVLDMSNGQLIAEGLTLSRIDESAESGLAWGNTPRTPTLSLGFQSNAVNVRELGRDQEGRAELLVEANQHAWLILKNEQAVRDKQLAEEHRQERFKLDCEQDVMSTFKRPRR